jgi:hypothetical protein
MLAREVGPAGHSPRRALPPVESTPIRLGIKQPGRAIFVGSPSLWSNSFQRPGISQARSVILYRAWLAGEATPGVLRCARFSEAEIIALERRRKAVLARLAEIRGHSLRCDCPPWETWCHGDVLLRVANARRE